MNMFKDRHDAGKQLAKKLIKFQKEKNVIVLGLPRGGVITAFEVAQALQLPLDIIVPRKLGAPINPEVAFGAVTEDGSIILDDNTVKMLGITEKEINEIVEQEKKEAQRRLKKYRQDKPELNLKNKTVIIVDDGIATGSTMRAAIESVKAHEAQTIIVAVPVCPPETAFKIAKQVDEMITIETPSDFMAVGQYYDIFPQTTDEEVIELLNTASKT